jgi:hypothetical protein
LDDNDDRSHLGEILALALNDVSFQQTCNHGNLKRSFICLVLGRVLGVYIHWRPTLLLLLQGQGYAVFKNHVERHVLQLSGAQDGGDW